jgi:hypothetical protein
MAWWENLVDWGSADWTSDPEAAHFRYVSHLNDMQAKKNWPVYLVEKLQSESQKVKGNVSTGELYWRTIAQNEATWMRSAGVEPGSLEKIDSHVLFIQSTGQAAEALEKAIAEYSPMNVAIEVTKETAKDIQDKADEVTDPTKSLWPWIAVGAVTLIVLVKLK